MNKTKAQRAETVNAIIKTIASVDRKFFEYQGAIANVFVKHNRVYMTNEFNKEIMALKTKYGYPPNGWHHGGTLWGLAQDFCEFIHSGGDTNHNNGYGGLYCTHWGYSEKGMELIQSKAKELGYLRGRAL